MPECPHRSETFRLEDCSTCKGNVRVKVFDCDLHGACSVSKKVEGIHVCDGIIPKPQAKPKPAKPTIIISPVSDYFPGTLLEKLTPSTATAAVRLDDGRTITAKNERRRQGHTRKRCVVAPQGEHWIYVQ